MKEKSSAWVDKPFVNKKISLSWLNFKVEGSFSEEFICVTQDHCLLHTRSYSKHVLHDNIDNKCRLCYHKSETLDHLLSSCEALAKSEYIIISVVLPILSAPVFSGTINHI